MERLSQEQINDRALRWVRRNNRNSEMDGGQITPGTDLFSTGILDSLAFVDLLSFIENETGCKIDLADIELEEFSTVEGLCRSALGNGSAT